MIVKAALVVLLGFVALMILAWLIQKVGGPLANVIVAIWEKWSPAPQERESRRLTVIAALVLIVGLAIVWLDGELHPEAPSTNCTRDYLGRDCD